MRICLRQKLFFLANIQSIDYALVNIKQLRACATDLWHAVQDKYICPQYSQKPILVSLHASCPEASPDDKLPSPGHETGLDKDIET